MNTTNLSTIAEWMAGELCQPAASAVHVSNVSTDTRSLQSGDLYIALRGEKYDGHEYIDQAINAGAASVVIDDKKYITEKLPCILVQDTLLALQNLATRYRQSLTDLRVVCITGSNGKTSTKDILRTLLSRKYNVTATAGNLNNHIGLPKTILAADSSHDMAVWELGMNHPGEIEPLAVMANPEVGIITNIGTAHIEFMKTRESIAHEKGQLAKTLPANGLLILNQNDEFTGQITAMTSAKVLMVGAADSAFSADEVKTSTDGLNFNIVAKGKKINTSINTYGKHMIDNTILCVAAADHYGVPIEDIVSALGDIKFSGGRLAKKEISDIIFLDDTYNANPDSVVAALDTLVSYPTQGRRIAVLGEMAEIGAESIQEHKKIGSHAASLPGLVTLLTVGPAGSSIAEGVREVSDSQLQVYEMQSTQHAGDWLRGELVAGDVVLVKGSRMAEMEEVINIFTK